MKQQDITGLAIDCAAGACVVAVGVGNTIVAEERYDEPHGHAAVLMPLIEKAFAAARVNLADMSFIAAAQGPGSFTGVRVGLSAAIGLGLARGLPVYGVSALDVLAAEATGAAHDIVAIVDGRRAEFFYQRFNAQGKALTDIHMALPEDIKKTIKPTDRVMDGPPSIQALYHLALKRFTSGDVPKGYPSALYVREPDVSLPKKHVY